MAPSGQGFDHGMGHAAGERSEHLSEETLAAFADHGSSGAEAGPALEHLARCRHCLAAYAEAVRHRVALTGSAESSHARDRRARHGPASVLRRGVPWGAAAGVLVAIGVGLGRWPQGVPPSVQLPGEVTRLLEDSSIEGLVYPGGENFSLESRRPYRSGEHGVPAERAAIDSLRWRYERGERDAAILYALSSALTASRRADLAQDYVSEGRALHPRHTGFLVLAAILARDRGDELGALSMLRQARAIAPADVTLMLDQALLLTAPEAMREREALLREVIRRAPGSSLAARAQRALREPAAR